MDPNATLELIQELLTAQMYEDATSLRTDLLAWIRRSGFEPDWNRYPAATDFVKYGPQVRN